MTSEVKPDTDRHRGRVTDARGRRVSQLDPVILHYGRRHDVIEAEALASIARAIGTGWAIPGQFIFTFIWSMVIVLMVIAHIVKWGGGLSVHPRELILWSVLGSLLVVNVIIVWFVSRWIRSKKVRRVMLAHRRCPHCGYDLKNLPTDSTDGATVCPECGCAWKLADLKTDEGKAATGTDRAAEANEALDG